MERDLGTQHPVAAGQFHRRLAHRAAAEERPHHHALRAGGRQPLAGAAERQALRLGRIAAHPHVLPVREAPAMERVLLHGGHDRFGAGVDGDAGVAALPVQHARRVGFRRHEPQAASVVVRCRDPLALRVEHQPGHGRGMLEHLERLARGGEDVRGLSHGAGDQPGLRVRMRRHLLHPFRTEPRHVRDRPVPPHAAEPPVIAARDPALGGRGQRQHRPGMDLDAGPCAGPGRQVYGAVAQREGRRAAPLEHGAHHIGAQAPLRAAAVQQVLGRGQPAHPFSSLTWHASNPRRSCGRFRLRPMNTSLLRRSAPGAQGPMKSPSAIMCTAWKAKRRSSFW